MSSTLDLVIVGMTPNAVVAAIDAARRGDRVLVVDQTVDRTVTRRFRESLGDADGLLDRIVILSGVDVECVDGVHTIEVVLLRLSRRLLVGINARAVLVTDPAQFRLPVRFSTTGSTAGGAA